MTLDEAIKECEEAAEDRAKMSKRCDDASGYSRSRNEAIRTNDAKEYEKCSQDFKQLAEWLRELKAYKEQEPCEDAREAIKTLKENLCSVCAYGTQKMESCDIRSCDNRDAIKALEQEPCEDAISRKAALEAILTRVPDFCGGDEGGNLVGRNETAYYIRNLPSVTPKQKWTPISKEMPDKKLPKDFQRVLVTVVNYAGDKVVRTANYISLRRSFRVIGSSNWWEIGEKGLLAWRPLPEPYKAAGK